MEKKIYFYPDKMKIHLLNMALSKRTFSLLSVTVLGALFFTGCRKKEAVETAVEPEPEPVNTELKRGLPPKPKAINGYLLAVNNSNQFSPQRSRLASFADPTRNLFF